MLSWKHSLISGACVFGFPCLFLRGTGEERGITLFHSLVAKKSEFTRKKVIFCSTTLPVTLSPFPVHRVGQAGGRCGLH